MKKILRMIIKKPGFASKFDIELIVDEDNKEYLKVFCKEIAAMLEEKNITFIDTRGRAHIFTGRDITEIKIKEVY